MLTTAKSTSTSPATMPTTRSASKRSRRSQPKRWYHIAVTYTGSRMAEGVTCSDRWQAGASEGSARHAVSAVRQCGQSFREPFRIGAGWGAGASIPRADRRCPHLQPRAEADGDRRDVASAESVNADRAKPDRRAPKPRTRRCAGTSSRMPQRRQIREAWKRLTALGSGARSPGAHLPDRDGDGGKSEAERHLPADPRRLRQARRDESSRAFLRSCLRCPPARRTIASASRKWLVDPANPLTARVTVNRFWQMYFGAGIVKTIEDFGVQGEWPSHPELLDWLATEFIRTGWDVKAMQKLIVTSATYRQSSKVTPELLQRDPENRLLARGPRFRLPAEMIRDQALYAAGLLVEKLGGPSVKPYQPAGLWKEQAMQDMDYVQSKGEDLYRRSLYTFWKRTIPPPMMTNFDAAGRESCVVRETRTNTPLQALNLMNDVTFVEAARFIGQRMMKEGGSDTPIPPAAMDSGSCSRTRLRTEPNSAFCRATCNYHRDYFASDPTKAEALPEAGRLARRSSARTRGAGRLRVGREPDPESGRGGHDPMSIDPITERKLLITRRHFFGRTATGIGIAALASLLGRGPARPTRHCPGCRTFAPKAKRVIYLFQHGAPSQLDLFDYKPVLKDSSRHEPARFDPQGPAAHRHDGVPDELSRPRRPSSSSRSTAKAGMWLSELLPHTAKIADDLVLIQSMHTEAINHDPAVTFFQTGFQLAGRPEHRLMDLLRPRQREPGPAGVRRDDLAGHGQLAGAGRSRVGQRLSADPVPGREVPLRRRSGAVSLEPAGLFARGPPALSRRPGEAERAEREGVSGPGDRHAHRAVRDGVPDAELGARADRPLDGAAVHVRAVRPRLAQARERYAANCMLARRLAERGVRFIQLFHRGWDQHNNLPREIGPQ